MKDNKVASLPSSPTSYQNKANGILGTAVKMK